MQLKNYNELIRKSNDINVDMSCISRKSDFT